MSLKKGNFRYIYRRNPGKLYNNTFCFTYLTKDQPPPGTLLIVVVSHIQCFGCQPEKTELGKENKRIRLSIKGRILFLKKNLNASRPSEHPPVRLFCINE